MTHVPGFNIPTPHWRKKLDLVKSSSSPDNIIISKQHINRDGSLGCSYSTYPLYYVPDYILSLPDPDRNIFEYLRGPRKPYFDCELERESGITPADISQYNICINRLLQNISTALTSRGYNYHPDTNLIRLTSHNHTKLSHHFIIDRFFFVDALDAKAFYHECIKDIPPLVLRYTNHKDQIKCIVDGSVYTERPFRLPFCTKLNKNRPLIPDPSSVYVPGPLDSADILAHNPNNRDILLKKWYILHSMICYTADCSVLSSFRSPTDNPNGLKPKPVDDRMISLYTDYYHKHPEINSCYDICHYENNYLYLKRKGTVLCPIKEHGYHKHNNSMICTDFDGMIVFKCFSHTGRKVLGSISDDDADSDDDEDIIYAFGGFNLITGEYNPAKAYEASFHRHATPADVIFFVNSLQKSPNCNIDTVTLRKHFTKYCNKNMLEPWFKRKSFDEILLSSDDISTSQTNNDKVFITGYTLDNVNTIVRPDLPDDLKPTVNNTQHNSNATARQPANAIVNGVVPKLFLKRPATTDDVKYFIDCLRVNDTTKYATCPELYAAFNNYCNRSELYTSVTNRMFTDFIVKSGHYNTIIDRKGRRVAIGFTISKGGKVERSDTLFDSSPLDGTKWTTGTSHPSENHLLNKKSTVNIGVEACVPSNVGRSEISRNSDANPEVLNPRRLSEIGAATGTLQCAPISVPQTVDCMITDELSHVSIPSLTNVGNPTANTSPLLNSGTHRCKINTSNAQITPFDETMLRDFWDAEMIPDPTGKVNIVSIYSSFTNWCKQNNVSSTLKTRGLSRLVASRFGFERSESHGVSYVHGWNVRQTMSNEQHIEKEDALIRIFTRWNDKYMIGHHNGPDPYSHMGGGDWRDIIINHHYTHERGANGRLKLPSISNMMSEFYSEPYLKRQLGIPYDSHVQPPEEFVLAIRSDMGSGKTEGIRPHIEACEAVRSRIDQNNNIKVLYVVPIITLANKVLNDLRELGFRIYSDDEVRSGAVIEGDRICTTYVNISWSMIY